MKVPVVINALPGTLYSDDTPGVCGPIEVRIAISVPELLMLRDAHRVLAEGADTRAVDGRLGEQEFHDARAIYFELLAFNIAPGVVAPTGELTIQLRRPS